jgi:hypothetical protein
MELNFLQDTERTVYVLQLFSVVGYVDITKLNTHIHFPEPFFDNTLIFSATEFHVGSGYLH